MTEKSLMQPLRFSIVAKMVLLFVSSTAFAHCDGTDGPVVIKTARKALEARDVNVALIWVQKKDEPELLWAFRDSQPRESLHLTLQPLLPKALEIGHGDSALRVTLGLLSWRRSIRAVD